jgi:hypothetical protein
MVDSSLASCAGVSVSTELLDPEPVVDFEVLPPEVPVFSDVDDFEVFDWLEEPVLDEDAMDERSLAKADSAVASVSWSVETCCSAWSADVSAASQPEDPPSEVVGVVVVVVVGSVVVVVVGLVVVVVVGRLVVVVEVDVEVPDPEPLEPEPSSAHSDDTAIKPAATACISTSTACWSDTIAAWSLLRLLVSLCGFTALVSSSSSVPEDSLDVTACESLFEADAASSSSFSVRIASAASRVVFASVRSDSSVAVSNVAMVWPVVTF